MTDDKAKRVIVASVVGAVVLFVILLSVLIFQYIKINVSNREYDSLVAQIEEYKELYAGAEDSLKAREDLYWIVQRARELGYEFDGENLVPNN